MGCYDASTSFLGLYFMKIALQKNGRSIDVSLLFSLFLIIVLPQVLFVELKLKSLSLGLSIAAVTTILFFLKKIQSITRKEGIYTAGFIFYVLLFTLATSMFKSNPKALLSIPAFILVVSTALLLSHSLRKADAENIKATFAIIFFTFSLLGWLEIVVGVHILNYSNLEKPIFPFSEESHFALAYGPIACAHGVSRSTKQKALVVLNLLCMSILLPNLTLFLFCIVSSLIFFRLRFLVVLILMMSAPALLILSSLNQDLIYSTSDYFTSRVSMDQDSKNLSALVYIQGWNEIYKGLTQDYGIGAGFQMLGTGEASLISERIYHIAGKYLNSEDGGFLAAKIIGEFGFVGLLACIYYIVAVCRSAKIISSQTKSADVSLGLKKKIFASIVVSYVVEFYFRGYGYFSPGLILALAALIALNPKESVKKGRLKTIARHTDFYRSGTT